MLRFVPDHLCTKKMHKNAIKQLSFVIRYVADIHKTQEMCNIVLLKNGGTLMLAPNCYNNQKICNKAIDNYAHLLEFVPIARRPKKYVIKLLILLFP